MKHAASRTNASPTAHAAARKIKPDELEEWRYAYNTTLTKEELETEKHHQEERLAKIGGLLEQARALCCRRQPAAGCCGRAAAGAGLRPPTPRLAAHAAPALARPLQVLASIRASTGMLGLNLEQYKHCFIRQLNPGLFPGRPKVSFLLQFFKRPQSVDLIVEPLYKCSRELSIELVVNVDHPQDADLWVSGLPGRRGRWLPC
jgi:hypothetical protein